MGQRSKSQLADIRWNTTQAFCGPLSAACEPIQKRHLIFSWQVQDVARIFLTYKQSQQIN